MARRLPPSAYAVPVAVDSARRRLANPFGTRRLREWTIPAGGSAAGLRGAQLQHTFARRLREEIGVVGDGTVTGFAANQPHLSYERLRAVLTGDAWMRFEDVGELMHQLGLDLSEFLGD